MVASLWGTSLVLADTKDGRPNKASPSELKKFPIARNDPNFDSEFGRSHVNNYIQNELKTKASVFNLTLKYKGMIPYAKDLFDDPSQVNQDVDVVREIVQVFTQNAYANPLLTAKPGRGKSHLLPLLALIFSYGAMPEHVQKELQLNNPLLKKFYDQYIKNTQIIRVDDEILSLDPTPEGEAFPGQDERKKLIVQGLFRAAKEDFVSTGRRTIFVFDEIATLPDLVQESLKIPLDSTGFRDSEDELQNKLDSGISAIGMTTPWEYERMIKGDGAKQRRWWRIKWQDLSAEKALDIAVKHEEILKKKFNGFEIDVSAIQFLIQMNELLYSPPAAMPDSILKAMDNLASWFIFNKSENGAQKRASLKDVQEWFLKTSGRSTLWLPGPNGEPPFQDLEEKILEKYKGDKELSQKIVHDICLPLKAWARGGFYGPPPVFILGSISGGGKNTIVEAISWALYNNNGAHQRHSIGGRRANSFEQLFAGELASGEHPGTLPLVIERRENGSGPAPIALDEAADAPWTFFNSLKVPTENGLVQPIGRDSRPRYLTEPLFILGEYGKELFLNEQGQVETDEAKVKAKYLSLTQKEIDEVFIHPRFAASGYGAIPFSLIQRAKVNGGIVLLPPTPKSAFRAIVDEKVKVYILEQKNKHNIDLTVDDSLKDLIVKHTIDTGEDARGLVSNIVRFISYPLFSVGPEKGMPYREAAINMTTDGKNVVLSALGGSKQVVHVPVEELFSKKAECGVNMDLLQKQ